MKTPNTVLNQHYALLIHVSVLLLLTVLSLFVSHAISGKMVPANFFANQVWQGLAINMASYSLVYFLVNLNNSKRWLKTLLITFSWLVAVSFTVWLDTVQLKQYNEPLLSHHVFYFLLVNTVVKSVFGLAALFAWMIINLIRQKLNFDELQLNTLQTQMSLLTSQTNPHFLFNTLNALYAKAYKTQQHELATDIGQLSALMHYSFTQTQKPLVQLEDEIDHIEAFIAMQKLRLNGKVDVSFHYGPLACDIKIPPMLLNPIIENAFKYGVNNQDKSSIDISLNFADNLLTLNVTNVDFSEQIKASTAFIQSGTGLTTLTRRLSLLFDDNYTFKTHKDTGLFNASLTIPCQ
ncbi:sensor histidine kinase [Thalassotalea marina]|nr:histidine kinase [Thalassotalea marina]